MKGIFQKRKERHREVPFLDLPKPDRRICRMAIESNLCFC